MNNDESNKEVAHFQPEKSLAKDLQHFSHETYANAKKVIKERMPRKLLALTKVYQEKEREYQKHLSMVAAVPREKRSRVDGHQEDKKLEGHGQEGEELFPYIENEFDAFKVESLELTIMVNTIKLWLQLNVPRIEDGNNFGVSIVADIVGDLARVEEQALMAVENWSKFLMARAKVLGKMQKHSSHKAVVEAYKVTLRSMDEDQLRNVLINWLDLRHNYAVIYDLIIKNMEKLLHPRSSNASNMY